MRWIAAIIGIGLSVPLAFAQEAPLFPSYDIFNRRFWVSGEFLFWDTKASNVPPLVTASPPGTSRTDAGVLSAPGTSVLFGNEGINGDWRPGFRIRGGMWFFEDGLWGVDTGFFMLGQDGTSFGAASPDGSSILSRPFFNAATGLPDAQLVSFPGVLAGGVAMSGTTDLLGAEINLRRRICGFADVCSPWAFHMYAFGGYRFLQLEDDITISESLTALSGTPTVPPGLRIEVQDAFDTENTFHGGQHGVGGKVVRGRLSLGLIGKLALGATRRRTNINGATLTQAPGGVPFERVGGLFAQGTNIGSHSATGFSVVPEVTLRVGVFITPRIELFAGYNFMYWSEVGRAGEQIDTVVNGTQIPPGTLVGPARPVFLDNTTDFWAHGALFGITCRY